MPIAVKQRQSEPDGASWNAQDKRSLNEVLLAPLRGGGRGGRVSHWHWESIAYGHGLTRLL
jgi:hypothetical protein